MGLLSAIKGKNFGNKTLGVGGRKFSWTENKEYKDPRAGWTDDDRAYGQTLFSDLHKKHGGSFRRAFKMRRNRHVTNAITNTVNKRIADRAAIKTKADAAAKQDALKAQGEKNLNLSLIPTTTPVTTTPVTTTPITTTPVSQGGGAGQLPATATSVGGGLGDIEQFQGFGLNSQVGTNFADNNLFSDFNKQ